MIEHVGSTSVPGLAAKPIIDILIEASVLPLPTPPSWPVDQLSPAVVLNEALAARGYVSNYDDGGKAFYKKADPRCNLWVYLAGDNRAKDLVLHRDYLRVYPVRAREYEVHKVSLALEHPTEMGTYTQGKASFIRRTLELAREAGDRT